MELIFTIVITLLLVGVVVWGIKSLPAVDPTFKQFAVVVIIVATAIWIIYKASPYLYFPR